MIIYYRHLNFFQKRFLPLQIENRQWDAMNTDNHPSVTANEKHFHWKTYHSHFNSNMFYEGKRN